MPKTFVLSDESVNAYGFRMLTDGIDTNQFERNPVMYLMHNREAGVIGRWENIQKKNGQLLADAVFDEKHEVGKEVARQVNDGFIRMASIGAYPVEVSDAEEHLVEGQSRPTVSKSSLFEVSIVDRGGNHNALISLSDGMNPIKLNEKLPLINKNPSSMKELEILALQLGLDQKASLAEVQDAIKLMATEKSSVEKKFNDLKTTIETNQTAEATQLVDKAVEAGIVPEALKEITLKSFEGEAFGEMKEKFTTLLADSQEDGSANQLDSFIMERKGQSRGAAQLSDKESYDYLHKHNPQKLNDIKLSQPDKYKKLVDGYVKGVRYNENNA